MYQAHALLSSFPALLCALSHRQTNHCPGRLQNCSLGTATIDPCTDIVLLVIISLSLLYTEHQHLAGKKKLFRQSVLEKNYFVYNYHDLDT